MDWLTLGVGCIAAVIGTLMLVAAIIGKDDGTGGAR